MGSSLSYFKSVVYLLETICGINWAPHFQFPKQEVECFTNWLNELQQHFPANTLWLILIYSIFNVLDSAVGTVSFFSWQLACLHVSVCVGKEDGAGRVWYTTEFLMSVWTVAKIKDIIIPVPLKYLFYLKTAWLYPDILLCEQQYFFYVWNPKSCFQPTVYIRIVCLMDCSSDRILWHPQ